MNRIILIGLSCILLLAIACKGTRESTSANASAVNIKVLSKNLGNASFNFNYLSAKARVTFNDGKINQSFTANMRMQDNKTIWMSLTGPFGIEGGRVLIDSDTIQILDRLNRKYYNEPFSYISNFIPIEADFGLLQNILLGNPLQVSLEKQKIEDPSNTNNLYVAEGSIGPVNATYFILPETYKYKEVNLVENGTERNGLMTFGDYKLVDSQPFAHERTLTFSEPNRSVTVRIDFKQVKKESSLTFPFDIPDRFLKSR